MKKFPYSDLEVYKIYRALHDRGLAMFLGIRDNEPVIWMSDRTPFTREPLSIATAAMILDEVLSRELDEAFTGPIEVLIGEVLDSIQYRARPPRRRVALLIGG